MMRTKVIAANVLLGSFLFASTAHAQQTTLTGCLTTSGTLVKVAIGTKPASKCSNLQKQVTFGSGGSSNGIQSIPFFIFIDGDGITKQIGKFGPFTLTAKCYKQLNGAAYSKFVEVDLSSTIAGWLGVGSVGLPANTPFTVNSFEVDPFDQAQYGGGGDSGISIAPDGTSMNLFVSLGLNVLGHDCMAEGTVEYFKANLGTSAVTAAHRGRQQALKQETATGHQ